MAFHWLSSGRHTGGILGASLWLSKHVEFHFLPVVTFAFTSSRGGLHASPSPIRNARPRFVVERPDPGWGGGDGEGKVGMSLAGGLMSFPSPAWWWVLPSTPRPGCDQALCCRRHRHHPDRPREQSVLFGTQQQLIGAGRKCPGTGRGAG